MFLAFTESVEDALFEALDDLGYPSDDLGIEEPPAAVDAVLASSLAFRLADAVGASPGEIAQSIAEAIDPAEYDYLEAVESAGPYLNFVPDAEYYTDTLEAAQSSSFGSLPDTNKSIVVEHTSANPTGPVHVGRARNPIVGDAVANLLEYAGHDVERQYYVNDAGRQIAVFTWAYETFDEADLPDPERDRIEYDMVRYYQQGNAYLEEADPDAVAEAEAEIQDILQGIDAGDEAVYERISAVVDPVLEGMAACLARLPAEFDAFIKETRFIQNGATQEVVARLKALDAAVYEEDAWQLEFDDIEKNLVFLRADGTSLYTTRDVAYHEWKLSEFDRVVTVLGEDHELQAKQLQATLALLDHDTDPLETVFYGWVNLPSGGSMSTRKGTGIQLDDLLDEAIERARHEVEVRLADRRRDDSLSEADIDRIAEQVGIGAVRYDIVSKQPTKGITFEWDRALDFEAQSAPYVQYVHARCCGILDEAGQHEVSFDLDLLTTPAERNLVRTIARFPGVIADAAESLEPHHIATYTRDISEQFNTFYRECQVLTDDPAVRAARLGLVIATRQTVANALDILGIEAPTSM